METNIGAKLEMSLYPAAAISLPLARATTLSSTNKLLVAVVVKVARRIPSVSPGYIQIMYSIVSIC